MLAIHASPKIRFERSTKREDGWDKKKMNDWSSFVWRDMKELEWGIGNLISMANIMIINEGSIQELKQKISELKW